MSQKPDRVAVTVIGCFGVFAIAVLAGAFGVLQWARGRRAPAPEEAAPVASAPDVTTSAQAASTRSGGAASTSSDDEAPVTSTSSGDAAPTANVIEAPIPSETPSATPEAPGSASASEPRPMPNGDLVLEVPIVSSDFTAVDVGELVKQARAVAVKLDPKAQLMGIEAVETQYGATNLTGSKTILYAFKSVSDDAQEPSGKAVRWIDVTAKRLKLQGVRRTYTAWRFNPGGEPIPSPACTGKRAWNAAVKEGAWESAAATLLYYDSTPSERGGPWVWSVRVPHPHEKRIEIDGQTCAILKNPSSPPDPSANGEAPAPSSVLPSSSGAPQASSTGPSVSSGSGCKLNINSIPTSMVQIDGRSVGSTPQLGLSVACGTRVVTFTHPEKGRKRVSVTASPTMVATVAVKF